MKLRSKIGIGVLAVFLAMQLVTCNRTNPPVVSDIKTPDDVKVVLRRACYDCHSNETVWRWYHRVAPGSWLVHSDVEEGRRHVNFSEWDAVPPEKRLKRLQGIAKVVASGDMPPWWYVYPMHPAANLSDKDTALLKAWAESAAKSRSSDGAGP